MAPDPKRQELRETNMRIKIKTEELNRLREEVNALKEQRAALKESLQEPATDA